MSVGFPTVPGDAWVLAPLIAGQPTYRLGGWIGRRFQYPRPAIAPKITKTVPERPAAVMIHGKDGSVATLCLDLDTSKAHRAVLEDDAARIRALLADCGLRWVEDFSPSGGRHLYVPLAERMPGELARQLVEALALTAESLDPSPHQNITDGCIRVPGSVHKSGGHQMLVTPLAEAYDVLRRRNSPDAITSFRDRLVPELRRQREQAARAAKAAARTPKPAITAHSARTESPLRRVARTGLYDTARYGSASEARMAVLNSFAASGWSLENVRSGIPARFPGLGALYGTQGRQDRLLDTEWAKAVAWTQNAGSPARGKRNAFINDTSHTKPTGGAGVSASTIAIHHLVNDLENVLFAVLDHRLMKLGRESQGLRFLVRALLGYMRTKETDLVDVGCRAFAVATGKHHATIARLLPRLASSSDGMISKIQDARGRGADVYLIELPEHHRQLARELSWRKGKIYGVRPVFRALGETAALVYEAIERGRHSPTTAEIVRSTGISRSAVSHALADMQALDMVHRDGRQWRITAATSLTELALRMGAIEDVEAQIARYRHERRLWHAHLARFSDETITETDIFDPERDEYWPPPDDADLWAAA